MRPGHTQAGAVRVAPLLLALALAVCAGLAGWVGLHNYGDGVDVDSQLARPVQAREPSAPTAPATEPTTSAIARGAYLARAGNCMACHTARGGAPYAGGHGVATPFGTVYSSNLTPDPATGLGRWNAAHFWRALHHGRSRDGRLLYPAFPYTSTTWVSRADSDALFAYLQSLPPVLASPPAHALRWPYSSQAALALWRSLYFRPAPNPSEQIDPSRPPAWNRGAYLVRGLGHCAACHSPRNALGASAGPLDLSGGLIPMQNWYAPALNASAQAGVAHWPLADTVRLLQTGHTAQAGVSGPMAQVVQHSTQHLTLADLNAMAVYLQALPQIQPPATPALASPSPLAPLGAKLYEQHCVQCHGQQGQGVPGAYPALAGNRAVALANTANLVQMVLYGGYPPATAGNPRPYGMPPYLLTLSDRDIAAVLSHLRTSWGHTAAPVTELEVNRVRTVR